MAGITLSRVEYRPLEPGVCRLGLEVRAAVEDEPDGTETVEEAIDALERIIEYTEEVDVGIQEIDDATEEQARTAQNVMGLIDDLTEISRETATEADSVADAARDQTESIEEVSPAD